MNNKDFTAESMLIVAIIVLLVSIIVPIALVSRDRRIAIEQEGIKNITESMVRKKMKEEPIIKEDVIIFIEEKEIKSQFEKDLRR